MEVSKRKRREEEPEMASNSVSNQAQAQIKVAAICGSLRRASRNSGLIRCAIEICKESIPGMKIDFIDIEPLPFVNVDLEKNGTYPPVVEAFRQKILEADCVLFASPEYNYSVSAPLKNAIDWASRPPNVWADKAAAIVSAAGGSGGQRSQYHIRQIGVFLDLHFINKPELFIAAKPPQTIFDNDGNVIDPDVKERLKSVLLSLQAFTLRLDRK
ncbi:NADPH:quinone oxidoreductase [Rhynchospora pubera]|uniref:NAD(P)H dehydrogenase (quinone) n=1 Tax=Rhynchospora pubera TaxID=906938 RepID=A0AAV8EG68_9POAL|nr:NADPH:quinone oxidoreductase [Rhynchospora pubera]